MLAFLLFRFSFLDFQHKMDNFHKQNEEELEIVRMEWVNMKKQQMQRERGDINSVLQYLGQWQVISTSRGASGSCTLLSSQRANSSTRGWRGMFLYAYTLRMHLLGA